VCLFFVAYLTLEQQLESLGHRWGNVCRLVEERGAALERTVALWAGFDDRYARFCDWLSHAETTLSQMKTVDALSDMQLITEQVQQLKVAAVSCCRHDDPFRQCFMRGGRCPKELSAYTRRQVPQRIN